MPLKSPAAQFARKGVKSKSYSVKRLSLLLVRIITRIEKITIFLGQEDVGDKELKSKITLLSSLFEVKKKIKLELKELEGDVSKTEGLFDNL